ncbi:T9SS C-terminal target domain-containing protein [Rhodohalobacter sp. SW132]|uniref:zinc-dependent metalloprotease n=1 Tax=Rhodohalobacter sp. SW132 TaxID=2293433 RepID=UPI000E23C394|nr:zinc-dependent metalloprotease [Rhodohalobacter sp. SW132]REL24161.1 T9SS C-terminal target domain-containing protein [Rhodohalobacter sp. SW132]
MKSIYTLFPAVLFTVLLIFPSSLFGQNTYLLNTFDGAQKQMVSETHSGLTHERSYFSLNREPLQEREMNVGDYMKVQLRESHGSILKITRTEQFTENTVSYIARSEENPDEMFVFTYSDGRIHGLYHQSHEEAFFFEYDPAMERHYIATGTPFQDDPQHCSVHEIADDLLTGFTHSSAKQKAVSVDGRQIPHLNAPGAVSDDEVTIDLLIPYTENARIWAEADTNFYSIDAVIAQSLNLSQSALDVSEIHINLRVVHYYETGYSDDSIENLDEDDPNYVAPGDHLRRLTRDSENPFDLCGRRSNCSESDFDGYFDEVHQLRDQYGADLVAAFLSEPNTGGIAWRSTSVTGLPQYGFSVNRIQQVANNYTLIHEIGHNMGNAHARNQNQAEAGEFGGIFVYSTGNRFSGSSNDYATVMAYDQDGFQGIPNFSNPDVLVSGIGTGTSIFHTGEAGPSNSALSMNQLRRVIASYRPTRTDPPVADFADVSVSVELNQENSTATVPITISNTGDSDLIWDIDFDIASSTIAKRQPTNGFEDAVQPASVDLSGSGGGMLTYSDGPGVLFSAGFEAGEGFTTGDHLALAGWRASSESALFEISDENPSGGTYNLRLPRRSGTSNSVGARSPFFGTQPTGEFRISFDVAIRNLSFGSSGEIFDIYFYDASTGSLSSGVIIDSENVWGWGAGEDGQGAFSSFIGSITENDKYHSFEIHYNPNNRTIDYSVNGVQAASSSYAPGRTPDYMYIGNRNEVSGSYIDIDNIEVRREFTPFNWMSVPRFEGVVQPGSTQSVDLVFNAVDVESGSYETVLLLRSNDPNNPVFELPISAEIEMATSAQTETDLPNRISLKQNYPNPFNPSTRIQFRLNESSDVRLDVFNVAGQRVATLVDGMMSAGSHEQTFNASGLSSGVYFYRLQTPKESLTRQMILVK